MDPHASILQLILSATKPAVPSGHLGEPAGSYQEFVPEIKLP